MSHLPDPLPATVPLFPLPQVVLFPGAILPLHIFEERYKAMVADALERDRQLGMALLQPGWEKSYYGRPAVEPVICVGAILNHEKIDDGKYNLLLQGRIRAEIVDEIQAAHPYRVAHFKPLVETPVIEMDLCNHRQRLMWIFTDTPLAEMPIVRQFRRLLASALSTAEVADLIAFNILEDVDLKQSLLAETNVCHRVFRLIAALETLRPIMEKKVKRRSLPQEGMN